MPEPVESKPWYASKTIIAIAVAAVASLIGYLTKNPALAEGVEAEASNVAPVIAQIVALISAIVAIIGRVAAKAKIGK